MFAIIFLGRFDANLRAAENGDWKWTKIKDAVQNLTATDASNQQDTTANI
jgi:hypothetical protein